MSQTRLPHAIFSVGLTISLATHTMAASGPAFTGGLPLHPISLISAGQTQSIYRHLVAQHWAPRTGLFSSFPDTIDRKLSQQASLYEQGAMGLLAVRLGDRARAESLLQFLKTAWDQAPQKNAGGARGLSNFYNAEFGTDGIEKSVHAGPNAWAALFAARFGNKMHNPEATAWALDVAYWMANAIPHQNGGIAMGLEDDPRGAPWAHVYSTENNLSYYALMTELLRCPSLEIGQRTAITLERDQVENWLLNSAFDRSSYKIARGIHPEGLDPVQALDTYTWFLSAIGPRRLAARGIDPFRLMRNAEKLFEVRLGERLGVDPADQTEADYVFAADHPSEANQALRPQEGRHRMIWYEGLGQYILALSNLAEYAEHIGQADTAREGIEKVRRLTEAFDQASLKNYPEGSAYPYATTGRFFRDGWRTPADGADGPASSLISGIWRCFAGLGMDPVSGRELGTIEKVQVSAPEGISLAQRKPGVLFGTSEEMTREAWKAFNEGRAEAAIAQAQATIQEWSSWATRLQQQKMSEVGHAIDYSGDPSEQKAVYKYWALNDVAACYFILGKSYHAKEDYANAALAFRQVINHYSLAQIWDPKGWFWSPADAINSEFVAPDPEHYGSVIPDQMAGALVGKQPQ